MNGYFEYTVKHSQEFGPDQYLVILRFPKSMEKEVKDFYQNGQRLIYDDESDWEQCMEWERQYFYRRQELAPDMSKLRRR